MVDVLRSFQKLAFDDKNYNLLLNDNASLTGLVILLSSDKDRTVLDILNIFTILSDKPNGLLPIQKLPGLRDQLTILSGDAKRISNIKETASKLLYFLFPLEREYSKSKMFGNERLGIKKSRSIVVQLTGTVSQNDLKSIETQLVRIRGVISVTFQLSKCRIVVLALTNIDPGLILAKVRDACEQNSSSPSHSISARVIRRQKSVRTFGVPSFEGDRRSICSEAFKVPQKPPPVHVENHPYLTSDADLFEVDESRGAPQRQDMANNRGEGPARVNGRDTVSAWLSDLLERTLFW